MFPIPILLGVAVYDVVELVMFAWWWVFLHEKPRSCYAYSMGLDRTGWTRLEELIQQWNELGLGFHYWESVPL
jgi:hypothetical protein